MAISFDFSSKLLVKPLDSCQKGGDGCKSKDWRLEKLSGTSKLHTAPPPVFQLLCMKVTFENPDLIMLHTNSHRLEDLRVKLEKEGYSNISYVVVNHQGISSRLKYVHLKNKVSEHIPVYQQEENQPDVWTLLNGNKDDFLIYDRCGRLVYHLGLPYSFLTFTYVEDSIKTVYCEDKCGNCSLKEEFREQKSMQQRIIITTK
ncbi:hypothetical protein E5288_WYG000682 [Bos mutus]|uniref:Selenoprotein P N-terminal domain-containing protein n=1 Tax=Bos mutus TaxID=72004 RepID=A0A6B0QRE2_9CETA|nr:hypothetical protein [Bos mutus]